MRLAHPVTRELLCLTAPPPDDMTDVAATVAGCERGELMGWLRPKLADSLAYSLDGFAFLPESPPC